MKEDAVRRGELRDGWRAAETSRAFLAGAGDIDQLLLGDDAFTNAVGIIFGNEDVVLSVDGEVLWVRCEGLRGSAGVLRVEERFEGAVGPPGAERLAAGDIKIPLGIDGEALAPRQTFHRIDDAGLHIDDADDFGKPADIEFFLARIEDDAGDAIEPGLVFRARGRTGLEKPRVPPEPPIVLPGLPARA
jgi:hypothetical protein